MPRLIFLQGGEDVKKRANRSMFEEVVKLSRAKTILVIPWTGDDREKESDYKAIFDEYFHDVGFREITFLQRNDEDTEIYQGNQDEPLSKQLAYFQRSLIHVYPSVIF